MNLLEGKRADLERELLEAMFTPGADQRVEALKMRLERRGHGQLRIVSDLAARPAEPEEGI